MTWKEEELAALTSVHDEINKKYKTATKKIQKTKDDLKAECISTQWCRDVMSLILTSSSEAKRDKMLKALNLVETRSD